MFKVKNLSHSYKLSNKNDLDILCDLNFELPNKGLVFITGKSGCGKTTLLNILEGILKPTSGEIIFDDIDIYKEKKFDFTLYNGILFQNYNLIDNLSVYENLKIVADLKNIDYKEIDNKLDKFNLLELKDSKIENLSGGEKQRIAFIRAILNNPKVIFCDEPTGAIDEENAKLLIDDLKEFAKTSLVIIVTHNRELIKNDDFKIELNKGKIVENNIIIDENTTKPNCLINKHKHKKRFLSILSSRLFSKSTFKHVLYIVSMFFSILFIELTLGLSFGLNNQKNNLEFSYYNYNKFSISEKEKKIETDSPISLVKEIRPSKDKIKRNLTCFKDFEIYNNYSYLLNGKNNIYSGSQELENIKIELYYNLKSGVIVNDLFYDLLDDKKAKISIELNQNCLYKKYNDNKFTETIDERFYYSKFFEIKQMVKEFKYLNTPTIYISLDEFELYLKETPLKNLYDKTKEVVSWYDAISNAKQDDPITSYSYDFYFEDDSETKICYSLIDNLNDNDLVKITNDPHFYVSSFLNITNILNLGLIIFCILSLLVTFALLFFIIISLYIQEKKEIAILKVLGTRNNEINSIFNNVIILETLFSFILATLINFSLTKFFNKIIYKHLAILNLISLPNFKNNITLSLMVILILFISILFVIFINTLAIYKASKNKAALELREE